MRERNNREIEQLKASNTLKPFKVMEKNSKEGFDSNREAIKQEKADKRY